MKAESLSGSRTCVRPFYWVGDNIKDPACPVHGLSKTQPRHKGRCPRTCRHFLSV